MSELGPTKAFLLAAGLGTRLRPITDSIPKCLVPLGGKPLLFWWLKTCEKIGVHQVLINTHHLADHVREFVRTSGSPLEIALFHEERLLGSAGTIAANKAFVAGERDFWIFYADTVIGGNLLALSAARRARGADLALGLFHSPDPRSGGVVELAKGGNIVSFEEKPKQPKSDLVAAGAYVASPALLDALPEREGDLSRDVIPKLLGRACGVVVEPVIDLGTPESYARAQKEWPRFGF
jgi:mannose-1-phosphate guanylyltransferase